MTTDLGFRWTVRRGEVLVTHHGRPAATLRGEVAAAFLAQADPDAPEEVQDDLARLTGNYKRGNERNARSHPRNRR